jgi:hypothetical protein
LRKFAKGVRAEHLDRDLGRGGAERDDLIGHCVAVGISGTLEQRDRLVRTERLHHALRNEEHGEDDRERQQDVERAPRQVDPEVADRRGGLSRDATHQRDQNRHARCRADEVLNGQSRHLREVAHRRLAAVALPVRIGGEADGGVPREIRCRRAKTLRVERKKTLQPLDGVDGENADTIEEQHGRRIGRPLHLARALIGRDAAKPVYCALDPTERPFEEERLALVDSRHIGAERLGRRDDRDEGEQNLRVTSDAHENFSGFRSATNK